VPSRLQGSHSVSVQLLGDSARWARGRRTSLHVPAKVSELLEVPAAALEGAGHALLVWRVWCRRRCRRRVGGVGRRGWGRRRGRAARGGCGVHSRLCSVVSSGRLGHERSQRAGGAVSGERPKARAVAHLEAKWVNPTSLGSAGPLRSSLERSQALTERMRRSQWRARSRPGERCLAFADVDLRRRRRWIAGSRRNRKQELCSPY